MTGPPSEKARVDTPTPADVEEMAATLAAEMIERWRQGERPLPEDFLHRHPELWNHPEAAAELIYEEFCLRQEYGPLIPASQVLDRFPQWRLQLELLLDCQSVLGPRSAAPQFPALGETVGDFMLQAELGRGAQGRVYLAAQQSLSNRRVVLKLVSPEACEHLLLARLQHTHIVPLYSVEHDPARKLRALCMPYFGGASLERLLELMQSIRPVRRTGRDLLAALDRVAGAHACAENPQDCKAISSGTNGSGRASLHALAGQAFPAAARQLIARSSYIQVICWIGACLADALQYAHERGLLHLDLKPSNVLLAADGQPMLLDFHLAREPVDPDDERIPWLGGTAGYMSPEQTAAVQAVQLGRSVTQAVDCHSDIYSLGVVLYEALTGSLPVSEKKHQILIEANEYISPGLADIITKCLAEDPSQRYRDMSALAADLRRHLADLPLTGVRNRSLKERWQKWRRRSPHGIARAGMLLTVCTAVVAVVFGSGNLFFQNTEQIRNALKEGRLQAANGEWTAAIRSLQRGQALAGDLPGRSDLKMELHAELSLAEQGRQGAERQAAARALHELADRLRFLQGTTTLPQNELRRLEASCRDFWSKRDQIASRLAPPHAGLEPGVRDDLLDIVLCWCDLQVQLAMPADKIAVRRTALAALADAEAVCGPSAVLDEERIQLGEPAPAVKGMPRTAWEHYALGRLFLRTGDTDRAAHEIAQAVRLQPQGLWPNFYQGLCAYRQGHFADAVTAFSVCIGAAPEAASCFYNRGRSFAALGNADRALDDYAQALHFDPKLKIAALNRGLLLFRAGRFSELGRDLWRMGIVTKN
ncbi:MAG TPA: protein kinase [Gemmataceae bacterium]|nr:protein kinase [Gemmataceae bacterium]